MPITINPIKKAIVKQSILKGNSYRKSMINAGYTKATAHHSSQEGVVKRCIEEIQRDFNKAQITPELVLSGLLNEFKTATKSADRQNALMLLGKYLAMFTDKSRVDMLATVTQEERGILDKYISPNRLTHST